MANASACKPCSSVGAGVFRIFIPNAKDPPRNRRCGLLPGPPHHDLLQGNTVSRAAPSRDHYFRIEPLDFFCSSLASGSAYELPTRSLDQFRNPFLRSDQGLAPLLAPDPGAGRLRRSGCAFLRWRAAWRQSLLVLDPSRPPLPRCRDVRVDVRQRPRSQAEKARTCPEDFADRLLLIGN